MISLEKTCVLENASGDKHFGNVIGANCPVVTTGMMFLWIGYKKKNKFSLTQIKKDLGQKELSQALKKVNPFGFIASTSNWGKMAINLWLLMTAILNNCVGVFESVRHDSPFLGLKRSSCVHLGDATFSTDRNATKEERQWMLRASP